MHYTEQLLRTIVESLRTEAKYHERHISQDLVQGLVDQAIVDTLNVVANSIEYAVENVEREK